MGYSRERRIRYRNIRAKRLGITEELAAEAPVPEVPEAPKEIDAEEARKMRKESKIAAKREKLEG